MSRLRHQFHQSQNTEQYDYDLTVYAIDFKTFASSNNHLYSCFKKKLVHSLAKLPVLGTTVS